MKMRSIKSWIESRTIWSILVMLAPVLSNILGFDVNATLADIITIAGAVSAIYFRIVAKSTLV